MVSATRVDNSNILALRRGINAGFLHNTALLLPSWAGSDNGVLVDNRQQVGNNKAPDFLKVRQLKDSSHLYVSSLRVQRLPFLPSPADPRTPGSHLCPLSTGRKMANQENKVSSPRELFLLPS